MFRASNENNSSINPEMNEFDILQQYLIKSEGLIRVLEKETEYFRESKMDQAEVLVEPKIKLVEALEEFKTVLVSKKDFLATLPEVQKQRIRTVSEKLKATSELNYQEALKAKEVNRMIMESVSSAIEQNRAKNSVYSEEGKAYGGVSTPSPMALNESI